MNSLRPTTFTLTLYDIAPILATLLRIIIFISITVFILLGLFIFEFKGDNGQKGINVVLQLQEVQEFKKAVEENSRSKFGIAEDREEGYYSIIKVFEAFPDHITTFNWYRVDNKTKKVEKLDILTDTWNQIK